MKSRMMLAVLFIVIVMNCALSVEYLEFEQGGKYGYIDPAHGVIIPAAFDGTTPFDQGRAIVRIGTKYQIINEKGAIIKSLPYRWVAAFSEGKAIYQDVDYGFLDHNGEIIISGLKNAYPFIDGIGVGRFKDIGWKFINDKGTLLSSSSYAQAYNFSDGFAAVRPQGSRLFGFIDKKFEIIMKPEYEDVFDGFKYGIALVNKGGKLLVINKQNSVLLSADYTFGFIISDSLFLGGTGSTYSPQWDLVSINGRVVLDNFSSEIGRVSSGMLLFKSTINQKYGFIDSSGRIAIDPIYDKAYNYLGGWARVLLNTRQGFVDKTGRVVWMD